MPGLRNVCKAAAIIASFAALQMSSSAQAAIEDTIVFLECTPAGGGPSSRGTGVVVTAEGHVLTAKHVIPDGGECTGSIGVADSGDRMILQDEHPNARFDAALLQFSRQQDYEFVPYCELESWMVRKKIFVAGFPGKTQTGVPSFREGILSTVRTRSNGTLETDGQSVSGMSGGPVFSKNLVGLVGIVIGAQFSSDGTVSDYSILPLNRIANYFRDLQPSTKDCYHKTRERDFTDPSTGDWKAIWKAGNRVVDLGVTPEEGFCFISSVFGDFNDKEDSVSIVVTDGRFHIEGNNKGSAGHGARAACVYHE